MPTSNVVSMFFPGWSGVVANIPWTKITHIIYAFAIPQSDGTLTFPDGEQKALDMKAARPSDSCVKVILSLGGATAPLANWKAIANNPATRTTFIANLKSWLTTNDFDGVDIDWRVTAFECSQS